MNHGLPNRYHSRAGILTLLRRLVTALPVLLGLGLLPACADMVRSEQPPGAGAAPSPVGGAASGKTVAFTLKTVDHAGGLVFVGVGGAIDGVMNPELRVGVGDRVEVTLINEEPSEHDIAVPDLHAQSARV